MRNFTKKLIYLVPIIVLTMSYFGANAQQWRANLPKKAQSEYTFFDYQKAFNDYWESYNVGANGRYIDENGKEKRASGYKQFRRWEWYWAPRVDHKTGKFPEKSAFDIWEEYKAKNDTKSTSGTWVSIGDHTLDPLDEPSLQESGTGRINCAAFDPNDLNHFWVGAPAGGLWETTDGGSTWTCKTDANPILGVSDIALSPNYSTDNTIYIATGDRDAGDDPSIGVLKSTDDGATWQKTGLNFNASAGAQAVRVIVDPGDANIIYVATSVGFYKSTDAGVSFTLKQTGNFIDMDMIYGSESGAGGADLIATTNTANAQAWRSTDAGETWAAVLTAPNAEEDRMDIAVTEADPNYVYVITGWDGGALGSIYRSTNAGASFTEVYDGGVSNNLFAWDQVNTRADGGQAFYDVTLAVSALDRDIVYVGGVNAFISTNGASSFVMSNRWDPAAGGSADEVHADHHNAYFVKTSPTTETLYDCNDGGFYYSTNASAGSAANWIDITDGLITGQQYDIGVNQQEAGSVVAGYQDNGGKYRDITTSATDWEQIREGDGMGSACDPTNKDIQWTSYPTGYVFQTTNEWASYSTIKATADAAWMFPVEADPRVTNTVYIGSQSVVRYVGGTSTTLGSLGAYLLTMDVYNDGSNLVIWTGSSSDLWKSDLNGQNYTSVYTGLPGNQVMDIAIDDDDYDHVYVSLGGYDYNVVYETTDGGSTWTDISSGLPPVPAGAIVINEQNTTEHEIYVGTDAGIFVKVGSEPWRLFNNGIPLVSITDLEIYYDATPANSKIYAATYGRDTWVSDMYTVDASPMTYVSSTTFQNEVSDVYPGTVKNEIIGIKVVTAGSTSPLNITSFSFNTNGSTNAATDLTSAKLYYSGVSNVFSTATQFGTAVANPSGNFTITGTQTLECGENYFWLVYDIDAGATINDYVDAECTSLTVGTPRTPTETAPFGRRQIVTGVYCDSYSGNLIDPNSFGISHVVFETIDNQVDPSSGHYNDYTAMSTTVDAGSSYPITVTLATGTNTFYATAWVDWNHDYDFNDLGEVFVLGSNTVDDGDVTGTIVVPNDALGGDTRMRIVSSFDNPPLNCGEYRYGETEDYTVTVVPMTPPAITSVDVTSGVAFKDGGKDITITGTDLSGATSVTVAGVPAHIITNTATQIDIETAGGAYSGANEIVVTNTVGSDSYAVTFTYDTRNIIPVNGGTDDHRKFQWALDDLYGWYGTTSFDAGEAPGAMYIDVYNGTYAEEIIPSTSLNPSATNQLVIQNHAGEQPVVNATGNSYGFYVGALDNVTITGFSVYGATNDNIYTEGDNNTISLNKSYNSVSGSGIKLSNAANSTVVNNLVYSNYNYGIHLVGSNNVEVDNNTTYDDGHSIVPATGVTIYTNDLETAIPIWDIASSNWGWYNGPNGNSGTGYFGLLSTTAISTLETSTPIDISGYTNIVISLWARDGANMNNSDYIQGEYSLDGGAWTQFFYKSNDQDAYAQFDNSGTPIINVGGTTFSNLDIRLTGKLGNTSRSWYIDDISVTGDEAVGGTAGAGLYVESGTGTSVENNIFVAKSGTDYVAMEADVSITSNYNTYFKNGNTNMVDYLAANYANIAAWTGNGAGADDLEADPDFVNPGTDFHIKSTNDSYAGGTWPPSTAQGGTWTTDASDSPALDTGNPADAFASEPASGNRINQGAYGNTAQASKSAAVCTAPTTQATVGSFTAVGETSLTINWTGGNGDNTLVVIHEGSSVDSDPISGNTYTADNSLPFTGSEIGTGNFVVYNGNGSSVTVSGLSGNTTYYVAIYEYLDTDVCYLLPGATGSQLTLPAQPSAITGSATPCEGSSQVYSVTDVSGITETWAFPAGWTITAGQGTNSVTVTVGSTDGNITCTPSNATGDGTAQTLAATVSLLPTAPTSVDATVNPVCLGSNTDLTYTGGSGTTFAWYSTSCGVGAVGTGNNYTVSPGADITYYGRWENACGQSACQTVTVTVTDVPAQPSAITGNTTPAQTSSQVYSVTNVPGVTYTWSFSAGWTITAGQGTNSVTVTVGATAGNVTVTPSNSCGDGTDQTLAVTPAAIPISWDGSTDTDWQTITNWTPEQIPTATDDVTIPNGMPNYPVVDDGIGTVAVCKDISIASAASVTINPNGYMTVSGSISNAAGNSGLVINSDATGTGSLIHNTSGGVDATVNTFLAASPRQWHMMGSPIATAPVSVFPTTSNLYSYNESVDDYWTGTNYDSPVNGWTAFNSGNMTVNAGYLYNYYQTTLTYTGQLNDNTTTNAINMVYTDNGVTAPNTTDYNAFDGWNYLSNPYTAAIYWDEATINHAAANLDDAVYYYDGANEQYAGWASGVGVNGGSAYIPAGQAFFVKANTGGGVLDIPSAAIVHNAQSFWKNTPENVIKLQIEGNGTTDETVVRFANDATENHDQNYDAYKLFSHGENIFQIYTKDQENIEYSINAQPSEWTENLAIPVALVNIPENFTVRINEFTLQGIDAFLKDNFKNEIFPLEMGAEFRFENTAMLDNNRFELIFAKSATNVENIYNKVDIYPNPNNGSFIVAVPNSEVVKTIKVVNAIGQIVYETNEISSNTNVQLQNSSAGVYFVKIEYNNNTTVNKKVVIE